jgi:hypothetical protein
MSAASREITGQVMSWPGVTAPDHQFGEIEG